MNHKAMKKISNILRKALIYFYYAGRPNIINPIHHLRVYYEGLCVNTLKTKHKELFKYIAQMVYLNDYVGCEYGDCLELYNTIKRLKPRYVLECGSGISSCVIAYALKENYVETNMGSKLISLEENPLYYEQIERLFPNELKIYVEFVLSERVEKKYGDYLGCHYKDVPDYPYSFVYIDGPLLRKNATSQKCFNSDLLNIFTRSNITVDALLDQRIGTYWVFKKCLPKAKIHYNVIKKLTSIYKTEGEGNYDNEKNSKKR